MISEPAAPEGASRTRPHRPGARRSDTRGWAHDDRHGRRPGRGSWRDGAWQCSWSEDRYDPAGWTAAGDQTRAPLERPAGGLRTDPAARRRRWLATWRGTTTAAAMAVSRTRLTVARGWTRPARGRVTGDREAGHRRDPSKLPWWRADPRGRRTEGDPAGGRVRPVRARILRARTGSGPSTSVHAPPCQRWRRAGGARWHERRAGERNLVRRPAVTGAMTVRRLLPLAGVVVLVLAACSSGARRRLTVRPGGFGATDDHPGAHRQPPA